MNDQTRDEQLDDVLDAYMATAASPDWATLVSWIERYPAFEQELTEFAVSWSRAEALAPVSEPAQAEVEERVRRGVAVARRVLAAQPGVAAAEAGATISSLLEAGRSRGLTPQQLAEQTDLSPVLVRQLDRRLIRYASIPGAVIDRIAQIVGEESASIRRYLMGGPRLAAGARYKAEQAPTLAEPQEFAAAVRSDPMLRADQRQRLLGLIARDADGAKGE